MVGIGPKQPPSRKGKLFVCDKLRVGTEIF